MKIVSRENAEHYHWKTVCDGWHFIKTEELSVIVEKMPPNTFEDAHFHRKARQLFYILSGEAEMKLRDGTITLEAGMGVEIEPMEVYQMTNVSDRSVEFIVVSAPKSHGDKEMASL